jgi:hypothetical protein
VTAKRGLYLEVMPLLIDQMKKRGVKIEKVLKKLLLKRKLT